MAYLNRQKLTCRFDPKGKTRLHQSTDVDEVGLDVIDKTLGPEDQLIRSQNLDKLLQQVRSLKPIYRDVIQLRFFQELSHKEMATQLGLSLSNVKVRLLRAKKLLAEIINDK